jgi:hypothetical protein
MNYFKRTRVGRMRFALISLGVSLFLAVPLWAQTDSRPSQQPLPALVGADNSATLADNENQENQENDDRMRTPPPLSGEPYSTLPSERSNYLRGGLSFSSAYTDNAYGAVPGHPVSDISYSIWPSIALDETTSRSHLIFNYSPGFTFYQRTSSLNEADHNAAIDFQYRLSPHVTFSARDGFQKTSNVFNQPNFAPVGVVQGGGQGPNLSIISPIADRLSNFGNVGLTYQFALNGMIGANGTFSYIHYPDPAQVPGLYDSNSQAGSAFYSLRISKMHYFSASYQYQRLVSYPTGGVGETQTHALLFFYTLYPTTRFSISFFGGPQHSNTLEPPMPPLQLQLPAMRSWSPAAGVSLSWQGRSNGFALSYSHMISGGGGLVGAVQMDSASVSVRQQITRTLGGFLSGGYAQNNVLGSQLSGSSNGHSVSGSASLQQTLGQHLNLQLAYTRLHQTYNDVAVISVAPDTNRESVSLSYQFSRPIGR